jgi:hypothetical protein
MWKALEHGMVGINAGVIATGMCRLAASSSRLGRETHTTAWMITSSSSTCVWRHPELISTDNQNVRISKTGLPSLIKKKGFSEPFFFMCALENFVAICKQPGNTLTESSAIIVARGCA